MLAIRKKKEGKQMVMAEEERKRKGEVESEERESFRDGEAERVR